MITCNITDKYFEIKSFADYFKYLNFIICKVAPYFLDSIHICLCSAVNTNYLLESDKYFYYVDLPYFPYV